MRLIGKGEFAKERGVSAGRVSQWLHDGRISATKEGKIDADAAHARLDAALDRSKGMRRTGNVTSMSDAGAPSGSAAGAASPAPSGVAPAAHPDGLNHQAAAMQTPGQPITPASEETGARQPAESSRPVQGSAHGDEAGKTGELGLDCQAAGNGETSSAGAEEGAGAAAKEGTRDNSGYWEHKAKREKYESQLAELKYLQAAGWLVHAAGVRREAMETARSVRNAMLAIPDNISAVLDPANPARAHKLLTGEIQKVLRELSFGLEQRAAAATAGAAEPERAIR